jgi:hypothetical protein
MSGPRHATMYQLRRFLASITYDAKRSLSLSTAIERNQSQRPLYRGSLTVATDSACYQLLLALPAARTRDACRQQTVFTAERGAKRKPMSLVTVKPSSIQNACLGFENVSYKLQRERVGLITLRGLASSLNTLDHWYSTFFVRVPPDIISLQLCTPKVVGA